MSLRSSTFNLEEPNFAFEQTPQRGAKKLVQPRTHLGESYEFTEDANDPEWKTEGTTSWKVIKKNKNIRCKLNFYMDRSYKVKQDLRSKKNGLCGMSQL